MNNIKLLFIAISLLFVSFEASARIDDIDEWWRDREITIQQNREDYSRRVYGRSAKSFTEKSGDPNWSLNNPSNPNSGNTKTVTKTVVVEDVPSKSKAGSAGLKRVKALAKGNVGSILGGAAITALIEAVGWVMEDGTYVKYKPEDDIQSCETNPSNCPLYVFIDRNGKPHPNYLSASQVTIDYLIQENPNRSYSYRDSNCPSSPSSNGICVVNYTANHVNNMYYPVNTSYIKNDDYDPNQEPKLKKIEITENDVGGLLLGDYDDPVDEQYDVKDNIYKPPLADLYQHDDSGIGNELANEMDQKIKNAPPTADGNPAPIGDPRFANPPEEDADTNDRSWTSDSDQVDGESTPVLDPETGEPTGAQSIKLQFPVFCEWAYIVCDWYDKWKKTDEWLKEEPQLENEQLEIQEENILDYQHENHVSFGQSCPFSPNTTVIDFGISSFSFETDLTFICTWGNQARAYVITLGHLGALIFLLLGIRNGNV